jgi:hypothetical protein
LSNKLHLGSHPPIHPKVVEQQLLSEHLPAILERGYATLMDMHRVEDVGRLYSLAARVGATETLKVAFKEYVRLTGLKLIKDEEKVRCFALGRGLVYLIRFSILVCRCFSAVILASLSRMALTVITLSG